MKRFYIEPLPNCDVTKLTGKLIVLEGADGSGRSTQILLLKNWLEERGYAVVDVGIKRSPLISVELDRARQGNTLGPTTMGLFYATDFMDQLKNVIIPALRAGFIVLADRYIYTLMARDMVRGADFEWVRNLYGLAIIPDIVFYLKVSPRKLIERRWKKANAMDYWESGMDLGLSRDWVESFLMYQKKLNQIYNRLHEIYGFVIINGNKSINAVFSDLIKKIEPVLK